MYESHKATLQKVKQAACLTLTAMVQECLHYASTELEKEVKSEQGQDAYLLKKSQSDIATRFKQQIAYGFDSLLGEKSDNPLDLVHSSLTLMGENELESVIALEGMITHARNCDITEYLRFSARLNELFSSKPIDESNNPLDPAQIGEAIKVAIESVGLCSEAQLTVYRQFNKAVFHRLEAVLAEANGLLAQNGVLPVLDVCGRDKEEIRTRRCNSRSRIDPNERAFEAPDELTLDTGSGQRDVFTLLQSLMHNDVHKVVTSSHIHDSIEATDLLFRAIWDDVSVPEYMRKLLGQTSFTILKTAIDDKSFWNSPAHPVRSLLNELADVRFKLSRDQSIDNDPLYQQARNLVIEFVNNLEEGEEQVSRQVRKFSEFKRLYLAKSKQQSNDRTLNKRKECRRRLEDAQRCANRKINERIRGKGLPDGTRRFLEHHFSNFLVEVILSQGAGGDSWKPIMKTVDLLIWSVGPGKNLGDREKLDRINEKLFSNLTKALRVARTETQEIDVMLSQIKQEQQDSFSLEQLHKNVEVTATPLDELVEPRAYSRHDTIEEPMDKRFLEEALNLPVGIWMEFIVDGAHTIRCTLAAKITDPDNYVFVNRQGVKVIEKSSAGVAKELEAGTARQISENNLVDRAIDTVIARLRASNEKPSKEESQLDSAA